MVTEYSIEGALINIYLHCILVLFSEDLMGVDHAEREQNTPSLLPSDFLPLITDPVLHLKLNGSQNSCNEFLNALHFCERIKSAETCLVEVGASPPLLYVKRTGHAEGPG